MRIYLSLFLIAFQFLAGCVSSAPYTYQQVPRTREAVIYAPPDARSSGTIRVEASRRGQAAGMYQGYPAQSEFAHRQALDMDRADLYWSQEDRAWARESLRARQMTQREYDAEVRREINLRRQADRERQSAIRSGQTVSREVQSWVRLIERRR